MRTALLKKYFRLAVRLLKFKTCKNFLNSKPPEDDQSFLFMQQMHLKEKKDLYKNLELEKRLNQSKSNDDATVDIAGKLDTSRGEGNKKPNTNIKFGKIHSKDQKNLLGIEDYDDSNVNFSSLYSSKLLKKNLFNTLDDHDFNRKINIAHKDSKSIELAEFPRENYSHRDKISNTFRESYIENNHQVLITESVNSEREVETERLNNNNLSKQINSREKYENFKKQHHSDHFDGDKDSLFHPENTKNKKNLNEAVVERIDSFGSSREIKRIPDLLILRENEARISLQDEKINDSYGVRLKQDQTVLSDVRPSTKFEKNASPDQGASNFLNIIRSMKSKQINNYDDKNENNNIKNFNSRNFNESRLLENNKINKIQSEESFKKPEEENKMNSDFMINVQSILIDNLRYKNF